MPIAWGSGHMSGLKPAGPKRPVCGWVAHGFHLHTSPVTSKQPAAPWDGSMVWTPPHRRPHPSPLDRLSGCVSNDQAAARAHAARHPQASPLSPWISPSCGQLFDHTPKSPAGQVRGSFPARGPWVSLSAPLLSPCSPWVSPCAHRFHLYGSRPSPQDSLWPHRIYLGPIGFTFLAASI